MSEDMAKALTIVVAAGKGGTGKTLLATSLARALVNGDGPGVELLDGDVEEPNAALLLRPRIVDTQTVTVLAPQVTDELCTRCGQCAQVCQFSAIAVIRDAILTFPHLCAACGACAYICPTGAIVEVEHEVGVVEMGVTDEGVDFYAGRVNVGALRSGPVTKALKAHAHADMITIIDAPPGTACPMQEMVEGADLCILVTEPTPFGLSDLGFAVETCRALGVPCGVIINRDGIGDSQVEEYCRDEELDVLLKIPHDRRIAEAYARGDTLVEAFPEWRRPLREMYRAIAQAAGAPRKERERCQASMEQAQGAKAP